MSKTKYNEASSLKRFEGICKQIPQSKSCYKIKQEFNNNTNTTFEELLVKAINTYVANRENVTFEQGAIHFQDNQLKCT